MIRLTVLSAGRPSASHLAKRFPVSIGRAADADLVLNAEGVWGRHATLRLDPSGRFLIGGESGALLIVNGVACPEAELRNGDVVDLGAARLRFSLSETRLRSHRVREWATWAGVALLCVVQILLVYWALP